MRFFYMRFLKKTQTQQIIVAYAFFLHAFVRKKRIRNCIVELRMCVTYAPSYKSIPCTLDIRAGGTTFRSLSVHNIKLFPRYLEFFIIPLATMYLYINF